MNFILQRIIIIFFIVLSLGAWSYGQAIIDPPCSITATATGAIACVGSNIQLAATGGSTYSWSGPASFSSTLANPTRSAATLAMSGTYTVTIQNSSACSATATTTVQVNEPPTLNPVGTGVCVGQSIVLSAGGGGGGGTTYIWSGPSGFSSSVANPVRANATTSMSGIYSITVSITNGCTSSATASVLVSPKPSTIAFGDDVCEGNAIELLATGNGSFSWSGPSGFSSTSANPIRNNANTSMAGLYSVTITGTNSCTASATTLVIVRSKPVVNVSGGGIYCKGTSIQLLATGGGSYSWAGPNFSSTQASPVISNATTSMNGTYSVTVTGINACLKTATTSISVNSQAASATGTSSLCEGQTISLGASSGSSYSWSGPDNFSSTQQNPSRSNVTTAMGGIYSVTVSTNGNCAGTATVSTKVLAKPAVSVSSDATSEFVCVGTAIHLSATGGTSYKWNGPNAFVASGPSPMILNSTTQMSGIYSVTASSNNGCTASASIKIGVTVCCSLTVTASGNGACTSGTLSLNAPSGYLYSWAGPASFNSTVQNPTRSNATTSMSGIYSVTVKKADNDCIASATVSLSVSSIIAVAGSNSPVSEGANIQLSASGGTMYSWVGPNGYSSTTQNPLRGNATSAMAGVYTVTVKNSSLCTTTATTSVKVNKLLGSLGDFVWKDENENGVQDNGEPGILKITVELYKTGAGANPIKTTQTDVDGYYLFDQLEIGEYKIRFVKSSFPAGTTLTTANAGFSDLLDSDADAFGYTPNVFINAGGIGVQRENPTLDAGLVTIHHDVALHKEVNTHLSVLDETITFTLKVINEGDFDVTGVEVEDLIPQGLKYISSSATKGTYSGQTFLWDIGDLKVGESVTLTINTKVVEEGVWYNTAQISKMNELDVDSTPGNNNENEDDLDRVCISIPFKICNDASESILASTPDGLKNIQWYKDGLPIKGATNQELEISEAGSYTFTSLKSTCPTGGCCPLIVQYIDCCKKDACVPFLISKK